MNEPVKLTKVTSILRTKTDKTSTSSTEPPLLDWRHVAIKRPLRSSLPLRGIRFNRNATNRLIRLNRLYRCRHLCRGSFLTFEYMPFESLFFTMPLENISDLHGTLGYYGLATLHCCEISVVSTVSTAVRYTTRALSCECDWKVSDHSTVPAPETTGNQRQWQSDICQSRRLLAIDGRQKAMGSRSGA